MTRRQLSERQKAFSALLRALRPELQTSPPIRFAVISGVAPDALQNALPILLSGICEVGDGHECFSPTDGKEGDTHVLFGQHATLKDGISCLEKFAPQITEALRTLFDGFTRSLDELKPDRYALFCAGLIRLVVDEMRKREPESLSLPVVVSGKPSHHSRSPDYLDYLSFPSGKIVHQDMSFRYDSWAETAAEVKDGKISIYVLETPLLVSAANIARTFAEKTEVVQQRTKRRKNPKRVDRLNLAGPESNPIIDGRQRPLLSSRAFRVVRALLDAKASGLPRITGPQLDTKSNTNDARKILKSLAAGDRYWKSILLFPRRKGDGYGMK